MRYSRRFAACVQAAFTQQFLERVAASSRDALASIPLDLKSYGRVALEGLHPSHARRAYTDLMQRSIDKDMPQDGRQIGGNDVNKSSRSQNNNMHTMVIHEMATLSSPNVWTLWNLGLFEATI
eukprot:GHVT01100819.1.p2 GENE.GHVT01100819.1~~GHVT01100819.1.p2  ORF type:complete len:123 (+),score=22.57 GHVT01100819.1:547-915(+)